MNNLTPSPPATPRFHRIRYASAVVAAINVVWLIVTTTVTAVNLPNDAGEAWRTIVSTPEYIPGALVAVSVGILIWSFWPRQELVDEQLDDPTVLPVRVAGGRAATDPAGGDAKGREGPSSGVSGEAETEAHDPTLVFVSYGGTCRDPMAKVIMESLVRGRQPAIRILATALMGPPAESASKAARHVVREETGADLLRDHRPLVLDKHLVREADLVLTMSEDQAEEIRKNVPDRSGRIFSLMSFVGRDGEVDNPWISHDAMDADTIKRYRTCFRSLRKTLTAHVEKIYAAVIA
jgi:protein-tyrosine-phosphatase